MLSNYKDDKRMESIKRYNNLQKIVHNIYCDICNKEMVQDDSIVLTTYPVQYKYICKECGYTTTSFWPYPWIEIIGDEVL